MVNAHFERLSYGAQRWCLIGHPGLWRGDAAHKKGKKGGPTATTVEPPFLTPKRSNLDQLKVSWSPVPLYFAAFFPSTPAENASQPSPAQAPGPPLVGSKLKPKAGESKYEAYTGSGGP